jgi:hypothetical protein
MNMQNGEHFFNSNIFQEEFFEMISIRKKFKNKKSTEVWENA